MPRRLLIVPALALLACAHAPAGAPPEVPEDQLRRIDRFVEESGRSRHPPALRSRFAQAALDELQPLLRARPDDAELHWLAALAWVALADEKGAAQQDEAAAKRALDELAAVLRIAPDGGRAEDVAVERGILHSKLGHVAEALADYERALALHAWAGPYVAGDPMERPPGRAALLYGNAADSLMALGRVPEAIRCYRLAHEHTPKDAASLLAMPHYGLAVALDRDGQPEAAAAELRAALVRDPELAELSDKNVFFVPPGEKLYYVALAERARGHDAAAAESLRQFLATNPLPAFAARARQHLAAIEASGTAK